MSSTQQVELLKQFVAICKADPSIIHQPQFSFYKEYLESLGAKIPPKESPSNPGAQAGEENKHQDEPSHVATEYPEIPAPELDKLDTLTDKTEDADLRLPMGDESLKVDEERIEKSNECRDVANKAFSEGDYSKALEYFSKAIELNPGIALLHAKRANTLIKMSKLTAAIRDCEQSIRINPDSAQGHKFRGRARRLLGHWEEAYNDFAIANRLDYDDTTYEWLKEVEPNAKKLHEYQRAKERQAEERELNERKERVRRAQEANKRASHEHAKEPEEGFGLFENLFKDDPELMNSIKNDPSIMTKLLECMQNPANMMKYMGDPVIQKLLAKFSAGGMGGGFPFGGDPVPEEPGTVPKKAPEPDLD